MFNKECRKNPLIRGGLIGISVPAILFSLFLILGSFRIAFGEHPLTAILIFAIALLELPVANIGRALNLPIEETGVAFILYNFNMLGYIFMFIFWASIGVILGLIISKIVRLLKSK